MTRKFGFALVGCGMIARVHADAISAIPGARVAALVSRTPGAGEKLLLDTGLTPCPVYDTLSHALRDDGVDAVVITTPSGAHLEPALEAAAAKKHVVVEKPLEITPDRSRKIVAACDAAGVQLSTIFPSRFADSSRALKGAADAGRFGRVTLGEATCKWWRSQEYYDQGGWKGTKALDGGGALMNQAIHTVDLLLWLMGTAVEVTGLVATLAHERIEVEDTAGAVIRFESGAIGVLQAATSVHPGYPKKIALHGDRGSAVLEQEDILAWDFATADAGDAALLQRFTTKIGASGGASDPKAITSEGHRRQLADFVEAVQAGCAPAVDGREGTRAVEVICAVYESAQSGRTVRLR